jgi:ribose transport system substrate-binding protein
MFGSQRTTALMTVLGLLSLSSCDSAEKVEKNGDGALHRLVAKSYLIGMSQCNFGEPWRAQMNADIAAAAAKQSNLKILFRDARNDSLTQRAQVEELAAAGVDLLIISPKESKPLTEPVAKVYKKGIPVIVLDRAVEGNDFTLFIGADNFRIGQAAGEWVRSTYGDKVNIVELKGLMTSSPAQERHAGFLSGIALAEHPFIKMVFDADMQWLEPIATKEMENALAAQASIQVVYAHNDPGAHGAYLAAKAVGREKEMHFVGIDALPQEGVRYVKEGLLDATFAYPTGGAEAIEAVERILAGEAVQKRITLKTRLYTKANVERGGDEVR